MFQRSGVSQAANQARGNGCLLGSRLFEGELTTTFQTDRCREYRRVNLHETICGMSVGEIRDTAAVLALAFRKLFRFYLLST